jgi:hypothetical protein
MSRFPVLALVAALATVPAPAQEVTDAQTAAEAVVNTQPVAVRAFTPAATPEQNREYVRAKQAALQKLNRLLPHKVPPKAQAAPAKGDAVEPVAPLATPDPLAPPAVKIVDTPLGPDATKNITGEVCEPSVAVSKGGAILYTGNWFAAFSATGVENLKYQNPAQMFPEKSSILDPPLGRSFCCDQVALYDAKHDLMIWFLQYGTNARTNFVRVAVASGDNIPAQKWTYYDFSPKSVGGWDNEWFDFPDLAVGENFLYVTTNTFATRGTPDTRDDPFARGVILRLPLAKLAAGQTIPKAEQKVYSRTDASGFRPTQGPPGPVMYFGTHDHSDYGRRIEVLAWSETGAQPVVKTFAVEPWGDSQGSEDYSSVCKDGHAWLNRADARMTAAWATKDQLGFAWTAPRRGGYSQPHVRVAVLSLDAGAPKAVIGQPHVWNPNFAVAYPGAAVNAAGEVGLAVCTGGGFGGADPRNPGLSVGLLTLGSPMSWRMSPVATGKTIGPPSGLWGDYMAVRADPRGDGKGFIACGFTMPAFLDPGEITRNTEEVVPRFVRFSTGEPPAKDPPPGPDPGTVPGLREKAQKLLEDAQKLQAAADQLRQDAEAILNAIGKTGPKNQGAPPPKKAPVTERDPGNR